MSNNEKKCRKSTVQEYQCQVMHKPKWSDKNISFDACLAKELFYLWDDDIQTIGSCCGKHVNSGKDTAYIQVREEDIKKMRKLKYKRRFFFKNRNCFIPKTA